MKAKHQRLILALAALTAVVGSGVLAMSAIGERASYFYAPSDIAREGAPQDKIVRLGGMVTKGSLVRDGVVYKFTVHDERNALPVVFKGIPPDLFKEGSGVVAEGMFEGCSLAPGMPGTCTFKASNLLAKHDENYKPPQMAGLQHKTDTLRQ